MLQKRFLLNFILKTFRKCFQDRPNGRSNGRLTAGWSDWLVKRTTNNSFFENSSKGSSNWNNSRVYSFENLPEPRNATKAYHSIQFDFDLQDGLIIAEEKSNKSYFNDEKDLTVNPNKKVNSNNNEEVQYHTIGYQYMQRNYTTSMME
ncbi:unnamed protein product [Rhizophagus irregularis]|nr:unnamed protein product [Rhizophagus irregularis]